MSLTDTELRAVLSNQQWTAHNIRLSPDVETRPGTLDFLTTNPQLHAVLRSLRLIFNNELCGLRIADLGCLEGGFTLALAKAGVEALGIEARAENVAKCNVLRDHFGLPNLHYVQDDVKHFSSEKYGEFDAVLALGILYHLDEPVQWLHQVGAMAKRAIIVESHFAPERDQDLELLRPAVRQLGEMKKFTVNDVPYEGRWFHEYENDAERDGMPWASYSNPDSLWLTRRSILMALRSVGLPLLYEQFDHWIDRYEVFMREYPRTMFVAVRNE